MVTIGHRVRSFADKGPCRILWHFHASSFHQVRAIHHHGAFAIEWCCKQSAVIGQATRHRRQNICCVVFSGQVIKRHKPAVFAPDRRFVHADCHDIERSTLGGDVRRDALAQNVFFQRDPFNIVARFGREIVGQTLHADHVTVVYGCDRQRFGESSAACECRKRSSRTKDILKVHPASPLCWM